MRKTLPDLEAKLSKSEASRLKREVMVQALNSKGDWLDRELKKIIPRDVYNMVHDYNGPEDAFLQRQEYVARYMKRADIRLEESGLCARLFKGKVLISQFYIKLAEN
jgi:hypothetical protein